MATGATTDIARNRSRLTGDVFGGITAGLVALPAAVAYGVAVFGPLGPGYISHGVTAGLLGAGALGVVAPLLGGAPRLISAPCAPAAAVLAAFASQLMSVAARDSGVLPSAERLAALVGLVTLLAGALQLLFGAVGVGRLIKYIPYPVVSGYLSAVAVLIFASQLPKFLGLPDQGGGWSGFWHPEQWRGIGVAIGGATVLGVGLGPRITKAAPPAIIGLAVGLLAYGAFACSFPALRSVEHNPLVIGPLMGGGGIRAAVESQWSGWAALGRADLRVVWIPALTLAVLLSVDTLKTCVVLDALTLSRHDPNRELIGQGAGNALAAMVGGMAGAGTMGATLVNRESGGSTKWSGVFEGLFVLAALLLVARWIAWVPIPALAGLLLVVAGRMFEWRNFGLLRQRATRFDFLVIAAVVIVAVKIGLIAAAGTGLFLAILLFMREQARGSVIHRKIGGDKISSKQHRLIAEQAVLERCGKQTVICELQGSLFFGTTDHLLTELERDLQQCRYLVLDWRRVRSVDFTAAHLLERFESQLAERGGFLVFSRLRQSLTSGQDLRHYFEQVGVLKDNVRLCDSLDDALQWVEDRILVEEMPARSEAEALLALDEFDVTRRFSDAAVALGVLQGCVTERALAGGDIIFRAGEHADELYLIRRGVVRIVLPLGSGNHHNLAAFGRGDFFGELAFLDGGARSADAVATSPVELFVLSRARFDEMARRNPAVGLSVLTELARALALRLRHSDAEIRALYEA